MRGVGRLMDTKEKAAKWAVLTFSSEIMEMARSGEVLLLLMVKVEGGLWERW